MPPVAISPSGTIDAGGAAPLVNMINRATGFNVAPAQNRSAGSPQGAGAPAAAGGYGTAGAAAAAPNPYQSGYNSLQGTIQSQLAQLNNLYGQLFGSVDNAAGTQRNSLEQGYNNQFQTLQDQYTQNTRSLPWMYAARGLDSSSFADNAQGDANRLYSDNTQQIQSNENDSLQQLAGWAAGQKAGAQAGQAWLGTLPGLLKGYGADASGIYGLSNVLGDINQKIADTSTQLGQFQPGSQLMSQLNKIAPSQNQGASQLQQQLSDLKQSSLPAFAANQIASGVISRNTQQDPNSANYWLNYYNNLSKPAGS